MIKPPSYIISNRKDDSNNTLSVLCMTEQNSIERLPKDSAT